MEKKAFVTKEMIEEIVKKYPTPFHIYDEKGIRENAKALKEAFSWNPGYKEFFAVKATPNPFLINILREYGCGCDCSSLTELMLSDAMGVKGEDIMFSSNDTPAHEFEYAAQIAATIQFHYFSNTGFPFQPMGIGGNTSFQTTLLIQLFQCFKGFIGLATIGQIFLLIILKKTFCAGTVKSRGHNFFRTVIIGIFNPINHLIIQII